LVAGSNLTDKYASMAKDRVSAVLSKYIVRHQNNFFRVIKIDPITPSSFRYNRFL
jgi:hypothetical protein